MADQQSVERPAVRFVRRTSAYKKLSEFLSSSVSEFLFYVLDYQDPVAVVKLDQCALNVKDIGTAANNAMDAAWNFPAKFESFREARLTPTVEEMFWS